MYGDGSLHELIVMRLEMLDKETGGDGLGSIDANINEPAQHSVYHHDNESDVPEGERVEPDIGEDKSEKSAESNCEDSDDKAKVLKGVVVSHELVIGVADLGALPRGVAVGDA